MAKKKSGDKVDRTQIYVAIIGVIGTILVTFITVGANRPAETTTTPLAGTIEAATSPSEAPATESTSSNGGLCLEEYFTDVDAGNRLSLQSGVSQRIVSKKDAVYGAQLFNDGILLGEMKFTAEGSSKSFRVISVIDAGCTPIFDFGNLDRPSAKEALADWENLGVTFASQDYRIRMGWYSGNQIELIFTEN